MGDSWRSIAARKQQERASRIPVEWRLQASQISSYGACVLDAPRRLGLLTTTELKITEDFDAVGLLDELANGRLQSVDVVRAFAKRTAIAHQLVNCCTELLFDDALKRAQEIDEHLAKTGKTIGPLHGLPISIKDCFRVKGYDASVGIASLCFKPATSNSALVDQLLSLGAVILAKTNIPLTMMALDSHNNVFGRTLNPLNRELTAGGSSGGEGALVAMRGSILGVGTDVGGSVRIPAFCNGLWGIKPSHGRVPYAGQESGQKPGSSKLGIEATAGPIATTLRDCELLLRVVADSAPEIYDVEVVAQDWSRQLPLILRGRKLRVGLIRTDAIARPLPIIDHLMDEVAKTLRASKESIEVVEVDASRILSRILKTFNGIVSIDGANAWFDHMEKTGEPLSPWLQGRLTRRKPKSTDEVRALQAQKSELQTEFLKVWSEAGGYWVTDDSKLHKGDRTLDVLLMPVAPHPVPGIDRWNIVNYTASLNLLDLPAGVLPLRQVREDDLKGDLPSSDPLNAWDKINREQWTKVDRKMYLGSPLSVQVVTPRLTERKLVEAMAVLDQALRPMKDGSVQPSSKL
ncbi:Acetamidase [Cercospora beticola]|uniref:amidase n=1 Tax=Cercospora beticola TaxID=122368 RepID=A0A2G5I231_CERBT|nr:Acetamidase [Cercospora beticola]PIA98839.1 Acetamidase [Cercospora beticola]WPA99557.1 hypothetical protein RHO25_004175 [Cercospora beticola]CAK1362306.1 unnamed protein product [Cercospora beticola]